MNHTLNSLTILNKTIEKIDGAYAPSTIRAYKANFERFIQFCEKCNVNALPANASEVTLYIAQLTKSGLKSSSIRIGVASISSIHRLNQFSDPTQHPDVKIEMRRMHRTLGRASKQAFGITHPILEKMLSALGNDLRSLRDKSILLASYDTMCRRSELAALRIEDLEIRESGMAYIRLRKSKTDQESMGQLIQISPETQKAILAWIKSANLTLEGHLFRAIYAQKALEHGIHGSQLNRIFKRIARAANLNPEIVSRISGHSFRVGAAQDLANSGASLPILLNKGRWTKTDTVMRYIEGVQIHL
jgi:site-specific recombinase XerD